MLIRHELTPNQFYLMWSINNGTSAPNLPAVLAVRRHLKVKGWILEDGRLSAKAIRIVKEINGFFKRSKRKTDKVVMGDDFDNHVTKYNELFPKKKLNTGKLARSSKNNLVPAFRWFFENTDFTWEEIIGATSSYLDDREDNNWNFTINSQYFIRKQELDKSWKSELSNWCLAFRDGSDKPEKSHFTEKVF